MAIMALERMITDARSAAGTNLWGAAVDLARRGAVKGVSDDGDEVHLLVKTSQRAIPFEVYLWPKEGDWGCDCEGRAKVCLHAAAAIIAMNKRADDDDPLPQAEKTFKVKLRYAFTSQGSDLSLERHVVHESTGRQEVLRSPLAQSNLIATRADAHVEALLTLRGEGVLDADTLRTLLGYLERDADITLDGEEVQISKEPVLFRVRVTDVEESFKLGIYRPPGIDRLYRGVARIGDTLHPTSHGTLTTKQRRALIKGIVFDKDDIGRLVGDYIPHLRDHIPVDIATTRLPDEKSLVPKVAVHLEECPEGLRMKGEIVYGDPPIARLHEGTFKVLGKTVPVRDLPKERAICREFEENVGRVVGFTHLLRPEEAATFLRELLPKHKGIVKGKVDPDRFRVVGKAVAPQLRVFRAAAADGEEEDWTLDVKFENAFGAADPMTVLTAWRFGRSLVPLLDGGYAPLPADWLKRHGPLLRELLEARDANGRLHRNATAGLVELLEDTEAEVPMDLRKLRAFLAGEQSLPVVPLPEGFRGELREYQRVGYQWLNFLRQMGLNGILADDMGLGKTVQALVTLAQTPGQHLVVAPTSVIRNWVREAERFVPDQSVSLYHGSKRQLTDARITLTSYALLRLDFDLLYEREWGYVVLDEAQAIKNSSSQTARATYQIRARHRLALTGTPIENRLEELWSLFRFLMPGLFGSLESFRDRFVRPIEAGEKEPRMALRSRIRPYVLRRLKSQVATELPPLTEIVLRCELGKEQRETYEGVRLAARRDVQAVLAEKGKTTITIEVLEALLRMRQACCDPSLLPGVTDEIAAAKLDRLEELLVDLVCDGHKALIFSQWTSLLDRVEIRLQSLDIQWLRLDGGTRNRQAVIDSFQDPEGPPVFLLSLKAGGTGVNLTAADYVIHLDPWWNPAVQKQATDRAHRIGQSKPVISIKMIAADTVEERILELQEAKKDLADAALGTGDVLIRSLNAEEIRSLFEGN
jgi:superfamily II DNA or RNA helicase